MEMLLYYLGLGFEHITDIYGYDHILFIAALVSVYNIKQWREILMLVTAFTIGHSVTLALATLNFVYLSSAIIEFLIPVTIFITAAGNFFYKEKKFSFFRFKYLITLFFGLIHGLGFSNFLKSILTEEESLIMPLLGFNLGVELGQLLIVFFILGLLWLLHRFTKISFVARNLAFSGFIAGMALMLIIDRTPHFGTNNNTKKSIEVELGDLSYCYPENEKSCNKTDSLFYILQKGEKMFLQWSKEKLLLSLNNNESMQYKTEFLSQFSQISQIQYLNDSIVLIFINDPNCCNCLNLKIDLELEDEILWVSPVFNDTLGNAILKKSDYMTSDF